MQVKDLDLSNFLVEGDFAIVVSWVSKLGRGPWKYNIWLHKIPDLASSLDYSLTWFPYSANEIADHLAKHGVKQVASFGRDFLPL